MVVPEFKAPDYFVDFMAEADDLLQAFRKQYPRLKLTDNFEPLSKREDNLFKKLPEQERFELVHAQMLFNSLFQVAYKKFFFLTPAARSNDDKAAMYYFKDEQVIREVDLLPRNMLGKLKKD